MEHLNTIILPRGLGKTTALVKHSAKTGITMCVLNRNMVDFTMNMAKGLSLKIKEPITHSDLLRIMNGARAPAYMGGISTKCNVLLDDADLFLVNALSKYLNLDTISLTI